MRLPGLARQFRDRARAIIRLGRLRRGLRKLRRQAGSRIDPELLARIHRAWGNAGWVADPGFLVEVANRAASRTGPFLDCGSGLTTVVVGTLAGARGIPVWSLEQDEEWYRRMAILLAELEVEGVTLWHAPLQIYDDFVWYDLRGRELPARFSTVFCDGPAVSRKKWDGEPGLNWRVGVVPVLKRLGIGFGEILLDDWEDPRCERLMARWQAEGLNPRVVETPSGSLLVACSSGDPDGPSST